MRDDVVDDCRGHDPGVGLAVRAQRAGAQECGTGSAPSGVIASGGWCLALCDWWLDAGLQGFHVVMLPREASTCPAIHPGTGAQHPGHYA